MNFFDSEVRKYYSYRLPKLNQRGREWRGPCPVHNGKDPNFTVNSRTGLAHCHSACGDKGWDMISLEAELRGIPIKEAMKSVCEITGHRGDDFYSTREEAHYDYLSADGKVLYRATRLRMGTGDKTFTQSRFDGQKFIKGTQGIEKVPYNLPELIANERVMVCEGEKAAETFRKLGFVATCNVGGAGSFGDDLVKYFVDKHVCIFADNDEPGREHALKVAAKLQPVAQSIRIVELPNLPEKGDITDFVDDGGTREQILDRIEASERWSPEWEFSLDIPHKNDKNLRTFIQSIEESGGYSAFWDLISQQGIETPWESLTETLGGGLRSGEVYVIGANQGAGKTSMAMQFGLHALKRGVPTLLFSMEMNHRSAFQRLCAIEGEVDLIEFMRFQKNYRADHSDFVEARKRIHQASTALSKFPLYVSNKAGVDPTYLLSEVKRLKRRDGIGLVILDHFQLMKTTEKLKSEYEKFTQISRSVKEVATEVDVPVILVSQTSRSNSSENRPELRVSDLRGSGAIEEDAAAVMLLYHDKEDYERTMLNRTFAKGPVKTWLSLGKNRFGMQGLSKPFLHMKRWTKFVEISNRDEEVLAS